jgi:TusA-related sulfurtransferase
MAPKIALDLAEIAWPGCLLQFKNTFDGLSPREVLEVLSNDPDVIKNILMIANRSKGKLIQQQQEGDLHRVFIRKE